MTLAASSGSKNYRVGNRDTSSILVVVDVELFNAMAKIDKDRWNGSSR
jgi:hypothetical protein